MSYLFGPVAGGALTAEPALLAMLIFFAISTLTGAIIWYASGRYRRSNPLASRQLNRLGQWLFWVGLAALTISGMFHENALFNRRFWLYLMLLAVYVVVFYALYFRHTQYPHLQRAQEAEQARRKKYVPSPQTLGMNQQQTSGEPTNRRRRRVNR